MKLGIIVSGGDAPGMNFVVSSIFEGLKKQGIELIGIIAGFKGLMENKTCNLDESMLEENKNFAGCVLKSSRAPEFKTPKGLKKGLATIKKQKLDALIILGGDGSLKGAKELVENGVKTIFIPATIDNDLKYSEYSLGFYTAVSACENYINCVMKTMQTFSRSCIFEVMGNNSGQIAQKTTNLVGADYEISEFKPLNLEKLSKDIKKNKKESLVIVAQEKKANLEELKNYLCEKTKRVFKVCSVGYLQRGYNPTKEEIKMAKAFSALAIECIRTHNFNKVLVFQNEKCKAISMNEIQ